MSRPATFLSTSMLLLTACLAPPSEVGLAPSIDAPREAERQAGAYPFGVLYTTIADDPYLLVASAAIQQWLDIEMPGSERERTDRVDSGLRYARISLDGRTAGDFVFPDYYDRQLREDCDREQWCRVHVVARTPTGLHTIYDVDTVEGYFARRPYPYGFDALDHWVFLRQKRFAPQLWAEVADWVMPLLRHLHPELLQRRIDNGGLDHDVALAEVTDLSGRSEILVLDGMGSGNFAIRLVRRADGLQYVGMTPAQLGYLLDLVVKEDGTREVRGYWPDLRPR